MKLVFEAGERVILGCPGTENAEGKYAYVSGSEGTVRSATGRGYWVEIHSGKFVLEHGTKELWFRDDQVFPSETLIYRCIDELIRAIDKLEELRGN